MSNNKKIIISQITSTGNALYFKNIEFNKLLEDHLLDFFNYKISEKDLIHLLEIKDDNRQEVEEFLVKSHSRFLQIPSVSKNIKNYKNGRDFRKEDIGIEEFLIELKILIANMYEY
jgi:hypothetical protein